MSTNSLFALNLRPERMANPQPPPAARVHRWGQTFAGAELAAAITRDASTQTYYTVRFLVDRERAADAYRAYAYFRWVDDTLDQETLTQEERHAFLAGQQGLLARCYRGQWPGALAPEERLLADLLDGNRKDRNGLHAYVDNMMAVMAFDARRRGCLITQEELDAYTYWLAVAVTEALHYFIGHDDHSPQGEARYLAATAAHITHMLRDTIEDLASGYYNVPSELLAAGDITPQDVGSEPYRLWVKQRVRLARACFAEGKQYLARVENARCRLAGCAYIARFEGVLDAIEREDYLLRDSYPECKGLSAIVRGSGLSLALAFPRSSRRSSLPASQSPIVSEANLLTKRRTRI